MWLRRFLVSFVTEGKMNIQERPWSELWWSCVLLELRRLKKAGRDNWHCHTLLFCQACHAINVDMCYSGRELCFFCWKYSFSSLFSLRFQVINKGTNQHFVFFFIVSFWQLITQVNSKISIGVLNIVLFGTHVLSPKT